MKFVVDAMCAEFGGIRTYAEHLLEQWEDDFPDDELHVLVQRGSSLSTGHHVRCEVAVPRPKVLGRPWRQTIQVRRLVRQVKPDAVLATLPSTTLLRPAAPVAVIVYDLRHELRPDQFSVAKRWMRNISYGRGYQVADGILAISQRSLDDLHNLHPKTREIPAAVAYLGADHVASWPEATGRGPAIAFAHHTNKNPELILDAWQLLQAQHVAVPPLLLVGVSDDRREQLLGAISERGLDESVRVAPFLPTDEFRQAMAESQMIVFPSDFEGFGLPVVEGMLLGIPVVIGPEAATTEIAGGHAFRMDDWSTAALATAVASALEMTAVERDRAQQHAQDFSWSRTVGQTREMLLRLARATDDQTS